VWDFDKGEALCGVPLLATDVKCFHSDAQRFASCGSDSALFIWQLDAAKHKLARSDIQVSCHLDILIKKSKIMLYMSSCMQRMRALRRHCLYMRMHAVCRIGSTNCRCLACHSMGACDWVYKVI